MDFIQKDYFFSIDVETILWIIFFGAAAGIAIILISKVFKND